MLECAEVEKMPTEIKAGLTPASQLALQQYTRLSAEQKQELSRAIAEAAISLEQDLRGPTAGSPGIGLPPGYRRKGKPQNKLAPGTGLVPINTGRLLSSHDVVVDGLSAKMVADARDPRSGFEYASVAHHAHQDKGDTVARVTPRWYAFAQQASDKMVDVLSRAMGLY